MQIRKEYKYLIPNDHLEILREKIRPFVEFDKYARLMPDHEYKVRSIYYDTGKMDYYAEKNSGVKIRKKFRIRGYGDTAENSTLFLEIKRKDNEIVWKNRAPVKYQYLQDFLITGNAEKYILNDSKFPHAVKDANRFLFHLYRQYLIPIVLIVYDREAFISKFSSDLRITFDKNIRSRVCNDVDGLFSHHKQSYCLKNHFVLEIKFNFGFPLWLHEIIREFRLVRQAVSKYSMCVDCHREELEMMFRHPSIEFFNHNLFNKHIYQEVLSTHDK
ncbi:MAG: polyphosphate polymerase domain-containing protein [Candidatus Marinimicrobia bacterium]|nr:polyphosphate polymerase domain-containing protein [Candidatus Neomarinimicrobiota bacterium]